VPEKFSPEDFPYNPETIHSWELIHDPEILQILYNNAISPILVRHKVHLSPLPLLIRFHGKQTAKRRGKF
jgi:hypothetical protein